MTNRLEVMQADIDALKEIFGFDHAHIDFEGDDARVLEILARHRGGKPSPTNAGNIIINGEEWVPLEAYREAMNGWKAANATPIETNSRTGDTAEGSGACPTGTAALVNRAQEVSALPGFDPLAGLIAQLREIGARCKETSVEWALADDDETSVVWLTRGETYCFIADQLEKGNLP